MTKPELVSVLLPEIQTGVPAPFPVFDAHHTLLLAEDGLVLGESQLTALQDIGMFRAPNWRQGESGNGSALATDDGNGSDSVARNFALLKLQPGTTLHLRRSDLPAQGFIAVKLLGWLAETDLLVGAIAPDGEALTLPVGAPLEVKLLAGNGIVSFQSTVQLACHVPYPHLHLAYPQELAVRQLRKSLRATVSLPAQVSGGGHAVSYDGMLGNLSASGCMLELPLLLALVGDEFLLTLALPAADLEHMLVLNAVVRNVRTEGGSIPMLRYGLEFLNAGTAERLVIEHFIYQSLLEN